MSSTDKVLHGDHFIDRTCELLDQASNVQIKHVAGPLAGAQVYATLALTAAVRDVVDRLDGLARLLEQR